MNKLFFAIIILLTACSTSRNSVAQESTKFKRDTYSVNYGGCFSSAIITPTFIKHNLYHDENGNIYFLACDRSGEDPKECQPVFILRFNNDCWMNSEYDTIIDFSTYDLSKTIDTATFVSLGNGNYQDKFNLYHHQDMADGGHFTIWGAATYEDLKNGFYRGSNGLLYIQTQSLISPPENYGPDFYRKVPDIDLETYESHGSLGYSKDKNHVYYIRATTDGKFIDVLDEADVASFEMIDNYRLAKDKNFVFEYGQIVKGMDPALIHSKEDFEKFKNK